MDSSNQQDQTKNSGMEDSTTMTVEFLRARVLSERTVSRTAIQRAHELAKRVAELEERLRIVNFQRMKAEMATENVLSILKSNGISNLSETFDSRSDQDTPSESKVGNEFTKEEESSVNSKVRKNESEELSGSDLDFSLAPGRSLSWKGHRDSPHSVEMHKDPSPRRRSNVLSVGSSPKHRAGKSCHQHRRKESRSVAEEFKASPVKISSPENRVATSSEVSPNIRGQRTSTEDVEIEGEKTLLGEIPSTLSENYQNATHSGLDCDAYGHDGDTEKALELQAQLIGQYEAMERAQREWEEKFRENNNSTSDFCDPGNRSDVTEERYDSKIQTPHSTGTITLQSDGAGLEVQRYSHVDTECLEHKSNSMSASKSPNQDFAFTVEKGKQDQESLRKYHGPSEDFRSVHPHSHGSNDSPACQSQSSSSFPSDTGSSFSKDKASGIQHEMYALVPHKAPGEFHSILEALKEAKQSLQQKIDRLPLVQNTSFGKSVVPSLPIATSGDKAEIPVERVGLFRLPTDFLVEGNTRANFHNSSTQPSVGNYHPGAGVQPPVSNQFVTRPYLESRSSLYIGGSPLVANQYMENVSQISAQYPYSNMGLPSSNQNTSIEDQFFTSQIAEKGSGISTQNTYLDTTVHSSSRYPSTEDGLFTSRNVEGGSRISTLKPYFFPNLDTGFPSSSRHAFSTYPTYPVNPFYSGQTPQMHTREGFSTFHPSRTTGMPPAYHSTFSNDHFRPTMCR